MGEDEEVMVFARRGRRPRQRRRPLASGRAPSHGHTSWLGLAAGLTLALVLTGIAALGLESPSRVRLTTPADPASAPARTASLASARREAVATTPDSARAAAAGSRSEPPLGIETGWGPSEREIARAVRLVSRLPLRDLAGQVIVASYSGTAAPVDLVRRLHLGGVITFPGNVAGTDQIRRVNRRLQRGVERPWPVFIGVDQEGGVVERLKGRLTRFPTFMTAGAADRPRVARRAYAGSGRELRGLGFTVDFAPVADVTSGPGDPTIGSRAAGGRPRLVARTATAAARGFRTAGVVPVLKHFPGHGSVPADSHQTLPVQRKSLSALRRSDLVPFAAGVRAGMSAVMVAHIDVRAVDPGVPSSVSRPVVSGLLRGELGFEGLVVTDALNMAGVARRFGSAESAVRALRAGADVLLMPPSPAAARAGIVEAVRRGALPLRRLRQAAARQVALLLHQRGMAAQALPPGGAARASYRLSRAGITVVSGRCSGRLVGRSVSVSGPSLAVARFRAAARRAGLDVGGGDRLALVGYGGGARSADVVVAMDRPYVLGASSARVKIATYGDTPGAMRALVDVLLGRRQAPGRLPVRVTGVDRPGC